jgi:hypothetical protein
VCLTIPSIWLYVIKLFITAHCLHDTLLQVSALRLVLERLPEFHHLDRVVLEQALVVSAGDPARNRMGLTVGAEGHENDHSDGGPHQPVGLARAIALEKPNKIKEKQ